MGNLTKEEILMLFNRMDFRKPEQEASIYTQLKEATIEGIDEIFLVLSERFDLPQVNCIDIGIREALFFFLLIIYTETKEKWRLEQLYRLMHKEMKDDKIGLRQFLNLFLSIFAPDEGLSTDAFITWSDASVKATDVGVLIGPETAAYGVQLSQDIFRTFRSALVCKVSDRLARIIAEKEAITYDHIKELSTYIGRMRHYLAIIQSGSVFSEKSLGFGREALRELCTPITGVPLYEKYLDIAKKNGAMPIVTYRSVVLVRYISDEEGVSWLHGDPSDREKITGFALKHLNALARAHRFECSFGNKMLDNCANAHYFLASTLPFDRGGSFIAEVIVNAAALLFGQVFSWRGELPDCHAFSCLNFDQYVVQYRSMTIVSAVGKLMYPPVLDKKDSNPIKRTSVSLKRAVKLGVRPDDSSDDSVSDEEGKLVRKEDAYKVLKKRPRPSYEAFFLKTEPKSKPKSKSRKKSGIEYIHPYVTFSKDAIVFNYPTNAPGKLYDICYPGAWVGRSILACGGIYDDLGCTIQISLGKLQAFFNGLCQIEKGNTPRLDATFHKRCAIIGHLYDAAKEHGISLHPLVFKKQSPYLLPNPTLLHQPTMDIPSHSGLEIGKPKGLDLGFFSEDSSLSMTSIADLDCDESFLLSLYREHFPTIDEEKITLPDFSSSLL